MFADRSEVIVNRKGQAVHLGPVDCLGGDIGLPASELFYCGKRKPGRCRCGGNCWSEICGFQGGCPCRDCVELLGCKFNKEGVLAKPGESLIVAEGGDTLTAPCDLMYCGKVWDGCRCGSCRHGSCGPIGCPCESCVELVGFKINSNGRLARRGCSEFSGNDPENDTIDTGGYTHLHPTQVFYCGQLGRVCRCGNCLTDRCGFFDGCPCWSCAELIGHYIHQSAREPLMLVNASTQTPADLLEQDYNYTETACNRAGFLARRGTPGFHGGSTGNDAGQVFYCGQIRKNACPCGDNSCGLFCGPDFGCPCDACLELTFAAFEHHQDLQNFEFSSPQNEEESNAESYNHGPDATLTFQQHEQEASDPSVPSEELQIPVDDNICVDCLKQDKSFILIPCGHFSYCQSCAMTITNCGVCQAHIVSRVKVFKD